MATWSRPRSRAIPFLPLLIFLAPLFYSGTAPPTPTPLDSREQQLQLIWASPPERGQCLPPPTASEGRLCHPPPTTLKRPDHLVLGPTAGQGRPDRLQCQENQELLYEHWANP
uniref:Uncharacterized protein n=1 Tax=Leersia perrieri TaxID=77586 RepID=A0A0D9XXB0_9ORYZ